jgi:hypothetical protein
MNLLVHSEELTHYGRSDDYLGPERGKSELRQH